MATFTQATSGFGVILGQVTTGWTNVRNLSTGTSVSQGTINNFSSCGVGVFSGRGAPTNRICRTFGWADLSAYAPNITTLSFDLQSHYVSSAGLNAVDCIVCESFAYSNAASTTLSTSDFNISGGWNVNKTYSSSTSWVSTPFSLTGNSTAISDANSQGYINFVVINNTYDYFDIDPGAAPVNLFGGVNLTPANNDVSGNYNAGYPNYLNGISVLVTVDNINDVGTSTIDNINDV